MKFVLVSKGISPENSLLLLENAFTRERFDWQAWDLRQMKLRIDLMKKISENTNWEESASKAANHLKESLKELGTIVDQKDATRVIAGHTHVEEALSQIRKIVFDL